jgi:hypothetical protein
VRFGFVLPNWFDGFRSGIPNLVEGADRRVAAGEGTALVAVERGELVPVAVGLAREQERPGVAGTQDVEGGFGHAQGGVADRGGVGRCSGDRPGQACHLRGELGTGGGGDREAMPDGIEPGPGLAGRRARAGAAPGILPVGGDLQGRRHVRPRR